MSICVFCGRDTLSHISYYELHFLQVRSDMYIHVILTTIPNTNILVPPAINCVCLCIKVHGDLKFAGEDLCTHYYQISAAEKTEAVIRDPRRLQA